MHSFACAVTTALSLSLLVGHAHAEESLESSNVISESTTDASLRLDVGLFSPIGTAGLVYSRSIAREAALEVGAGIGFSGLQLSGMAKLQLGDGRTKFTPGIGLSVGLPVLGSSVHEGHPNGDEDMQGSPVTMAWLDIDLLGVQHRTRSGMILSASGGVAVALTKGHWDAAGLGDTIHPGDILPQARVGIGKAF